MTLPALTRHRSARAAYRRVLISSQPLADGTGPGAAGSGSSAMDDAPATCARSSNNPSLQAPPTILGTYRSVDVRPDCVTTVRSAVRRLSQRITLFAVSWRVGGSDA